MQMTVSKLLNNTGFTLLYFECGPTNCNYILLYALAYNKEINEIVFSLSVIENELLNVLLVRLDQATQLIVNHIVSLLFK